MPKPQKIECYKTANGLVETLAEWKHAQLLAIFQPVTDGTAAVVTALGHADEIAEILSHREKGRPNGKKDSKPRKPKEPTQTA